MRGTTAIIIGGGAVGVDFHLPRLLVHCAMRSVDIVEPAESRRAQLVERFRGRDDVRLWAELPAGGDYAVGVIATPPRFHLEYVALLHARCAALVVEKPLAHDLAAAEAIAATLATSTTRAFVCHIRRALGSFALVRAVVEDGLLGELRAVSVHEGGVFAWRAASLGSFSRELNGGGVLMDTGPHTIDLLLQVFDELQLKAAWMDAERRPAGRAIEANCVLELAGDGIPITLTLSRNRYLSNQARFTFAHGELCVDVRDNTLALSSGRVRLAGVAALGDARRMDFNALFDAYYAGFVASGNNSGVTPAEAVRGMRVIDAAYRGARLIEQGF